MTLNPIDFGLLHSQHPEFSPEWETIRAWITKRPKRDFAEADALLLATPALSRLRLDFALEIMLKHGMLRKAYRVRHPHGYLLEGNFFTLGGLPKRLPDRDHSCTVRVAECEVVSGYLFAAA